MFSPFLCNLVYEYVFVSTTFRLLWIYNRHQVESKYGHCWLNDDTFPNVSQWARLAQNVLIGFDVRSLLEIPCIRMLFFVIGIWVLSMLRCSLQKYQSRFCRFYSWCHSSVFLYLYIYCNKVLLSENPFWYDILSVFEVFSSYDSCLGLLCNKESLWPPSLDIH